MVPYLGVEPLSRPGCWAYADMLVVGNRAVDAPWVLPLSRDEAQSHFSMWAVTSSPLGEFLRLEPACHSQGH